MLILTERLLGVHQTRGSPGARGLAPASVAWSDHRTPTRRGSARPDLAQLEPQAGKLGASLQVFDAFESL
jgi:hypothetical protein